MLLRSFLQLIALLLFSLVFVTVLLLLSAYAGYLGGDARVWVEWGWAEAIARRELIEEVFALAGAIGTLTISALGVYKSWHFAELNLPARLEDLSRHWTRAINASRPAVVPELRLETISFAPPRSRGFVGKLSALVYDPDQAALRRCTKKVSKFEAELRALGEGQRRCQKEIATRYLELGSLLKRCDPDAGQGALNLFKKALEVDQQDLDALELSARQALSNGMREQARDYLLRLAMATQPSKGLRHARALRFHAEFLRGGNAADRSLARVQLETAIAVLNESDGGDTRTRDLGLTYEMLARVHVAARRFRLARASLAEAKRYLGDIDRLKDIDDTIS